jgi:hypothetical protein
MSITCVDAWHYFCKRGNSADYYFRVCEGKSEDKEFTVDVNSEYKACSLPTFGNYVTSVCVQGSFLSLGSDTVQARCTLPSNTTDEFVYKQCDAGSPFRLGTDAVILPVCPTGSYYPDNNGVCVQCSDHKSTTRASPFCNICQVLVIILQSVYSI